MHPPGADTVLVRYGDIGVKSRTVQWEMERTLRANLGAMLARRGIDGDVGGERARPRIRVDPEELKAATEAATDVFGVVSASPCIVVEPTMEAIREALAATARERYDGGSFAVRAHRAGGPNAHPFTSEDLEREGGEAAWGAAEDEGVDPEVDLDDPDYTFGVDCRTEEAFVFTEKRPGPGGLPVGSQRPLLALISGGIDSPVAAWEAMKRGSPIVPLYFDFEEYGGVDHVTRAIESIRTLASYAPNHDLTPRVAPAGEAADQLLDALEGTRMLSLRRFMFRVAEELARAEEAVGIVTGEAIGQKSSQTSANLATTDPATSLPVHRPLLTRDKQSIVEQAREIGTYEEATIPAGCNRIAPDRPETNATLETVEDAEPDLEPLVEDALAGIETVPL